mgnify:CR=1 FL=1
MKRNIKGAAQTKLTMLDNAGLYSKAKNLPKVLAGMGNIIAGGPILRGISTFAKILSGNPGGAVNATKYGLRNLRSYSNNIIKESAAQTTKLKNLQSSLKTLKNTTTKPVPKPPTPTTIFRETGKHITKQFEHPMVSGYSKTTGKWMDI